jgi:endo-1,4-beta-xylanase
MSTVKTILSIFVIFVLASCSTGTPAITSIDLPTNPPPPTPTATPGATSAPTEPPTATTDPYSTWSTNFANLASPAEAGITGYNLESHASDEQFSIETANVNSGGKAIKDSGAMDAQHHPLITSITIRGLTGTDSLDLSEKTLAIEMFVPADSPVSSFLIALSSRDQKMFVSWDALARQGHWYTYLVDLSMLLALDSWQYADWFHPAGFTSTDAVNLLKNVQSIQVYGNADQSIQSQMNAYFLIDQLGWTPSDPLPVFDPSVDSLRKYANARNLPIGCTFGYTESSDPQFLRLLLQQSNFLVSEQPVYWPATEPLDDNFDAFAQQSVDTYEDNLSDRLGTPAMRYLAYDHFPDWLKTKSYEQTKTILENYVRAMVIQHKGKTKIWFLFAEELRYDVGWVPYLGLGLKDRNQSPQTWENNYSPISASPSDVTMIEDIFRVAHEADPDAWLYLLDGANDEMGQARPDAFYNLAAKLVSDGAPIKGAGLEGHLFVNPDNKIHASDLTPHALAFDPTNGLTGIAANVERFQALGLDVVFSEVDVPIYLADIDTTAAGQQKLAERLQIQADVYRSLMHITLTHSNMPAFVFFGSWADQFTGWSTDPDPVKQRYGDPGIFDVNFNPKPAYYALLEELKGSQ